MKPTFEIKGGLNADNISDSLAGFIEQGYAIVSVFWNSNVNSYEAVIQGQSQTPAPAAK